MGQNLGWIEIAFTAIIGLGFGVWQLVSVNREIARDRAAKAAREKADANSASAFGPGHAEGQQALDSR